MPERCAARFFTHSYPVDVPMRNLLLVETQQAYLRILGSSSSSGGGCTETSCKFEKKEYYAYDGECGVGLLRMLSWDMGMS